MYAAKALSAAFHVLNLYSYALPLYLEFDFEISSRRGWRPSRIQMSSKFLKSSSSEIRY
jgi:riboflavin transporter FmnP